MIDPFLWITCIWQLIVCRHRFIRFLFLYFLQRIGKSIRNGAQLIFCCIFVADILYCRSKNILCHTFSGFDHCQTIFLSFMAEWRCTCQISGDYQLRLTIQSNIFISVISGNTCIALYGNVLIAVYSSHITEVTGNRTTYKNNGSIFTVDCRTTCWIAVVFQSDTRVQAKHCWIWNLYDRAFCFLSLVIWEFTWNSKCCTVTSICKKLKLAVCSFYREHSSFVRFSLCLSCNCHICCCWLNINFFATDLNSTVKHDRLADLNGRRTRIGCFIIICYCRNSLLQGLIIYYISSIIFNRISIRISNHNPRIFYSFCALTFLRIHFFILFRLLLCLSLFCRCRICWCLFRCRSLLCRGIVCCRCISCCICCIPAICYRCFCITASCIFGTGISGAFFWHGRHIALSGKYCCRSASCCKCPCKNYCK